MPLYKHSWRYSHATQYLIEYRFNITVSQQSTCWPIVKYKGDLSAWRVFSSIWSTPCNQFAGCLLSEWNEYWLRPPFWQLLWRNPRFRLYMQTIAWVTILLAMSTVGVEQNNIIWEKSVNISFLLILKIHLMAMPGTAISEGGAILLRLPLYQTVQIANFIWEIPVKWNNI